MTIAYKPLIISAYILPQLIAVCVNDEYQTTLIFRVFVGKVIPIFEDKRRDITQFHGRVGDWIIHSSEHIWNELTVWSRL